MRLDNLTPGRLIQILVLIIIGASALVGLFVVGRLFVNAPDYLPPTIDPLVPTLELSVTVTENQQAVISGTTNLPEGTLLTITLQKEGGNYSSEDQATVTGGTFQSGLFGSGGGLEFGPYSVEVRTSYAYEQPEEVRDRLGGNGENLVGDLVFQTENGAVAQIEARFVVVRPAPVLLDCTGPGIGQMKMNAAFEYELILSAAYTTTEAYGVTPAPAANRDYGTKFVLVEISYKNITDKVQFVSSSDFVLFIKEEFALTDINTPYTYYPSSRFASLQEAKDAGFFGLKEVPPGETFTGKIAFTVPDISRQYVFSTTANSCYEQDGILQCYTDYPTFEFQN